MLLMRLETIFTGKFLAFCFHTITLITLMF
jgi:hypothetical protein